VRSIVVVAIVVIAIVVGCWTYDPPQYDDVLFWCDDMHACPSPQMCVGGICQYVGSMRNGVECGSGPCVDTQCCFAEVRSDGGVDGGTAYCLDPRMRCSGEAGARTLGAMCDGVEDCPEGTQCCDNGAFYGASCSLGTCEDQFCVDGSDCTGNYRYCCPPNPENYFDVYFWRCASSPISPLCKMNMMSR